MASITLRSAVGRPLTNSEVDANFSALNLELGQKLVASLNLLDLPNPAQARSNLGLGNVENKSSATIRGELTSGNVTGALGYTPLSTGGGTITGPYLDFSSAQTWLRITSGPGTFNIGDDDVVNLAGGALSAVPFSRASVGEAIFSTYAYGANQGDNRTHFGYNNGSNYVNYIRGAATYHDSGTFNIAGYQALHAGNYSSYALPLSGGSITGGVVIDAGTSNQASDATLYVSAANSNDWGIRIAKSAADYGLLAELGAGSVYGFRVMFGGIERFRVGDSSQTISGNQILHAANFAGYALALSGGSLSGSFSAPKISVGGTTDLNFGVAGNSHLSGYLYMDSIGAIGSYTAWSSRQYASGGTHYLNTNVFQVNRYGYDPAAGVIFSVDVKGTDVPNGYLKSKRVEYNWFQWGGNPGGAYLHIKTNLWGGGSPNGNQMPTMSMFHIKGYTYDAQNINSMIGFHNWSGTAYNLSLTNLGGRAAAQGAYVSSDGFIVLVINTGTNYPGISIDYYQSYPYEYRSVSVTSYYSSSSTSGVY